MSERDPLIASSSRSDGHQAEHERRDLDVFVTQIEEPEELRSNVVLKAQGHKPEMARSFSFFGALGMGFTITNSWVGYMSCFGINLKYAGPNSVVFGVIVAVILQWSISAALYEIASCFPSAGGGSSVLPSNLFSSPGNA